MTKKVLRSEMDQINLPDPVLSDIRELQKESRELHDQLTEMVQKMRCMKQCKTEQTGEEKKMKLYNTMSKTKEEFVPLEEGKDKDVCLRTYCLQLHPYRKCKTDDRV